MWATLFEFAWKLLNGEVYRIWQAHKINEAINEQNKVASLSDADVANELQQYTRK